MKGDAVFFFWVRILTSGIAPFRARRATIGDGLIGSVPTNRKTQQVSRIGRVPLKSSRAFLLANGYPIEYFMDHL